MIRSLTALTCILLCATQDDKARQYVAGNYFLSVDGVACGFLKGVEGGDPRADVVAEPAGADRIANKHLAAVRYTPIVLSVGFQAGKPVFDWMAELLAGKTVLKTVVITTLDYKLDPKSALKATNCALTRITFPGPDGASKDPGYLTLTLAPEKTESVPPAALPAGTLAGAKTEQKVWLPQNFNFQIDGLDATKVSKIEALTVVSKAPAALEIPNLVITLHEISAAGWRAWLEDFVVKGNNADDKEKHGSLEFQTPNRQKVLLTVKLRNMGILTAGNARVEANADSVRRVTAELYCERMELVAPAEVLEPVTGIAVTPVAPAPAAPAAGNAEDKGGGDPADFPRPAGLVRKAYLTNRTKTGTSETVSYTSTALVQDLEAMYDKGLRSAGWEQINRLEAGEAAKGVVMIAWKKGARSAQVTLAPSKEGTQIVVVVGEKK